MLEAKWVAVVHRWISAVVSAATAMFLAINCAAAQDGTPKPPHAVDPDVRAVELMIDDFKSGSRSHWRIPSAYLSPQLKLRGSSAPAIELVFALPDLRPWAGSGLDERRVEDRARKLMLVVRSGEDYSIEKTVIPRRLATRWDYVGEFGNDFRRYRLVTKNDRGEVLGASSVPLMILLPREQRPGAAAYLACGISCTVNTDLHENIIAEYWIDKSLLDDWRRVDRHLREVIGKFLWVQNDVAGNR